MFLKKIRKPLWRAAVSFAAACAFVVSTLFSPARTAAQGVAPLPAPGMVGFSQPFVPPLLKGLIISQQNPFEFDFIVDNGDAPLGDEAFKEESLKLVRYFLASLTLPEDELWVNLSPYEKDRIIADEFGRTQMGQDMLGQDYLLKQLTASLVVPESELGGRFWEEVYRRASELYGSTDIPLNTFNKIWIVPDEALIEAEDDRVIIVESRLKVMLEEDYLALANNSLEGHTGGQAEELSAMSAEILKEVIIPAIEQEVNTGANFARLRQIYNSFILAAWYKENLKSSILSRAYADQKKVEGIESAEEGVTEKIYNQYLDAFRSGVYDIIKEEYDAGAQALVPRKYFSGGVALSAPATRPARVAEDFSARVVKVSLRRPTGGAITFDGKDLSQKTEDEIDEAIRFDFEDGVAIDLSDRIRDLDPDGITSANDVTVWEIPRLAAMDKFLAAHAGRGGEANDHLKKAVYLSPEKVRLISRLSPAAKRQFWEHEVLGHIVMNTKQNRRLSEEEVMDAYPVDLVMEEVLVDNIEYLMASTTDLKALKGPWEITKDDIEAISHWLSREGSPIMPEAGLLKKLANHILVIYTSNKEGVGQAQRWVTMLADKWGVEPVKLGNMFKWMLQNKMNNLRQVSDGVFLSFMMAFIEASRDYTDLRKEFVYYLPPGLSIDERLQLAEGNIRRMQSMFSQNFLRNRSVLKAPIAGTDYYIAMQYGIAESTHGIYLALGKEASGSQPMQGVVMRIGLDTQDDILRINLVQGVKTITPDKISEAFMDEWMQYFSNDLNEKLLEKLNKFLDKTKDRQLINQLGNEMSAKIIGDIKSALGMHPADALGYIALRIAGQGHVRLFQGRLEDPADRFSELLGISTEYLITRKNGTPSINPMVRYNKLGLRQDKAVGKAPEGFGRWQTVEHLTQSLLPERLAAGGIKAKSIQLVLDAFDNLEEISVRLTDADAPATRDGSPRAVTRDSAMLSQAGEEAEPVGGIDFNRGYLNLRTQGARPVLPVTIPRDMPALEIDGLVPVIINISPAVNIPLLLGGSSGRGAFEVTRN